MTKIALRTRSEKRRLKLLGLSLRTIAVIVFAELMAVPAVGDGVSHVIDPPLAGEGTPASPFIVSNMTTLVGFRDWTNAGGASSNVYFRQTADIDMSLAGEWSGIGTESNPFQGVYDGANHVVSNLKLCAHKSRTDYGGLFAVARNAIIRNLRVKNVSTDNDDFFGAAVVGQLYGGTLLNVSASGALSGNYNIGGLVCRGAQNRIVFDSCTNCVDIKTTYTKAGGFMSYTMDAESVTITNCLNVGSVTVDQSVKNEEAAGAGFVGYSCALLRIENCQNKGDVRVSVCSNVVQDAMYGSVSAAGAVAWISAYRNPTVFVNGFVNSGSITATNQKDGRRAVASGVLGDPNWYYGFFRCQFVLDRVDVVTQDIQAQGANSVTAAFFGCNPRYNPKTGMGTCLLSGRAPTEIKPFGNWDFEVGGYNATRKDGDYTIYYVRNETEIDDPGAGGGEFKPDDPAVVRERSFSEVWGAWSVEDVSSYVCPSGVTDLVDLGLAAWRMRDMLMRGGQFGCLPPSEHPIVMSVGTFSYNGMLVGRNGETLRMDTECGVSVWHVRICEDSQNGVLRMTVGGVEVNPVSIPAYDHRAWTESVYGDPPAWLDASEKTTWYEKRARSRVEMFATLVPFSDYATYRANVASDEASIAPEDKDKVLVREFSPAQASDALHVLNVRMPNASAATLLGAPDLNGSNWMISGVGTLPSGRSASGVVSDSPTFFVKVVGDSAAVSSSGDNDGDGVSDVLETHVYHTDPTKKSTSGDGLSDGEKLFRYELSTSTGDSDGDGFDDVEEIALGQDPKTATPGAATTIRYVYDDDDRLTGTYFGNNGRSTMELSPAGNPLVIEKRGAK